MNSHLNYIQNWPELARESKWCVNTLAKRCNVSVRMLERYFLKKMGKCPKTWLTEQRMLLAMELVNSGSRVKEAAIRLDYKQQSHLSNEFNQFWGFYPTKGPVTKRLQTP